MARACSLCHRELGRRQVNAGGDIGRCHFRCFLAFDTAAEAFELTEVALPPADLRGADRFQEAARG